MKSWIFTPAKAGVPAHADFECPHCSVHTLHNVVGDDVEYTDNETIELSSSPLDAIPCKTKLTHWIMRCVKCQRDTYFLTKGEAEPEPYARAMSIHEVSHLRKRHPIVVHQYPVPTSAIHKAVPKAVIDSAIEAEKCLSVSAHNACGVMTRRAIHSLCEDKSAKGKDLFGQLEYLKANHLITPDLWTWSEELRVLGKHGAHPEWPEVSEDQAEYGVKFLREIVRYVYINPYERSQKRLKETSKKNP